MKRFAIIIILISIITTVTYSQDKEEKQRKYSIDGYVTNMQTIMTTDGVTGNWVSDNLIHNRLNYSWYANDYFTLKVGARTRFFSGETVKNSPNYAENMQKDNGFINLNTNVFSEKSFLLNSQIDRANISYERGNLNITLGRQRINWGRSFVWNPNDIFNSYSFFDFDYIEKPGADALRIQYYTGASSSVDFVVKSDSSEKISMAGLYRFAVGNYDMQIMGGEINEQDYVAGFGWEGEIKSVALKGEFTYLHPNTNITDTSGIVVSCVSASYGFSNSAFLQFEFLYNEQVNKSNFASYLTQPLSVKNLSFTEYNLFGSFAYPITPLFNVNLSVMYYPKVEGFYAGTSLTYSLAENVDFVVILQSFHLTNYTPSLNQEKGLDMTFAFLQLKYNF